MASATYVKHSKSDYTSTNQGLTIVHPSPDAPKKSPADEPTVDIVAVPGLGANPEWTWKSKNKVNWLQDSNMLPRTVTTARIMVFGYESQWFGKGAIKQRLSTVANQLVQALFFLRAKGSKRPIVFVCHCLGGIIVEQALLSAQQQQTGYPNLITSVVGCVFLGTPFRGTKSQAKASLLAQMAQSVGLGVNSGLLTLLEKDSEVLMDLLSEFSALARESNIQLVCFFEQHESDLTRLVYKGAPFKHKELIVDENSALINGWRHFALPADHFELNKFTGPKDGSYISVSGEINATVQNASIILKTRQNAIRQTLFDDGTYQTILEDLRATDVKKDREDSIRGRPIDQASWALTNETYIKWEEAKESKNLWIHGKAGKGQPVVAASIIDHLAEKTTSNEGAFVTYFFCDEKDSHRRSIRDIIKLLIRQMISKSRDLTEYLLVDEGKGKEGRRKSQDFEAVPLATLWKTLQKIFNDAFVERVYIVVNAFDETEEEARKEFLQLFDSYLEPDSADSGSDEHVVKWLFLSRSGRPDIAKSQTKGLVICLEDKEIQGLVDVGVKRDISGQVDALAKERKLNNALTYLIKRYLYTKADGNYIYVHLVVQELKNLEPTKTDISTIRKLLENLPYGLTNMFEFIRRRVLGTPNGGIEYTKEILRCMSLVMESPTLSELALIADLPQETRYDEAAIHRYIRQCGAFLTTTTDDNGNEIVEWIDSAAKEHLRIYAKDDLSLDLNDVQHGIIALRCLEHVRRVFSVQMDEQDNPGVQVRTLSDPQNDVELLAQGEPENEDDIEPVKNAERANADGTSDASQEEGTNDAIQAEEEVQQGPEPILEYAVDYWLEHAMQAPEDMVEELDLKTDFWKGDSPVRAAWWSSYSETTKFEGVTNITPLHLAAMMGFSTLLQCLLDNGRKEELTITDSSDNTPLAWACFKGDVAVVTQLLNARADTEMPGEQPGVSALWAAASCRHIEIVDQLLDHGAEVNWQSETLGTPLYTSAENFSLDIVRLLLRKGADVNLKGGEHVRPLNVAAYAGAVDIVELLLEHDIKVDPDDDYRYGSALGAAARRGHADIVRLLLKNGWDANRKIKTYKSPLVAAATYGHAEVVQVLQAQEFEYTQELDYTSKKQALEIASKNGRTVVVELLLDRWPNLRHQKAFHDAASYGRDDVLELLVKRGTNPEMLNTALFDASDHERESTVKLLLKFGADPNAEGKEYGNALQAAAYDGSAGIVGALLTAKADVNKRGGDYGTALQAAAIHGHEGVVRMLLNHGAQVNTGNIGRYGSALQAASRWQSDTVVQLLIDSGAEVNAAGGFYGSPLLAAVDESMQTNVEILVKHGADVNVTDFRDEHAPVLVQAGYTLRKETLELLLEHGADIEGTDDHGTTVLISVADSGDKESLEMLLARGANIHAVSREYGTALSAAASEGDEECLRVLLDHGGDPNQLCGDLGTALQAASDAKDLDCINMLLKAGAEVNQITDTSYGCALQAAAFSGDPTCLQRLLDAEAEANLAGGEYGCSLQAAAYSGNIDCLQILLDNGAEVNLEGGLYNSALQAAAAQGTLEIVEILLDHGAEVNLEGGRYQSALQAAAAQGTLEIVKILLDHEARVDSAGGLYGSPMQASAVGSNIDCWNLLLEKGADARITGGKYGSALQAAALKTDSTFVERVLAQNVDINLVAGKYGTALQAAMLAKSSGIVEVLLKHHANPQLEGGFYGTSLNAAARRGNIASLELLLDQALPYNMLDDALIQAIYYRRAEAVEMLLKKGASVEATNSVLGSALDLLRKDAGVDNNSDNEEDADEEDWDEEGESIISDEEDEGPEAGDDDGDEQGSNHGVSVGTRSESIPDLQLDEPKTAESKIQKYLEEAKSKLKRNPTLRPPPALGRKPVGQQVLIPENTDQYDVLGNINAQQVQSAWQEE
ncbi:MAG: hypothetical protein Q9195_004960 [Heterodermia aff. obscurata]